jgi:hypothetical protein
MLLQGNGVAKTLPEICPLALFVLASMVIAA